MKTYKYKEWDILEGTEMGGWDDRIYVDSAGRKITGILQGFYGYTADTTDPQNSQKVVEGRRVNE